MYFCGGVVGFSWLCFCDGGVCFVIVFLGGVVVFLVVFFVVFFLWREALEKRVVDKCWRRVL